MKKILLFLTISFIYLISSTTIVNASTDSFYEAEYIDNIYMVRYDKSTKTKYYQKARVYKRTSDGKLAYCLQPFTKFNPNDNTYETVGTFPDINEETLKKIKDILLPLQRFPYINHLQEVQRTHRCRLSQIPRQKYFPHHTGSVPVLR